jgi:hypothetical protein
VANGEKGSRQWAVGSGEKGRRQRAEMARENVTVLTISFLTPFIYRPLSTISTLSTLSTFYFIHPNFFFPVNLLTHQLVNS